MQDKSPKKTTPNAGQVPQGTIPMPKPLPYSTNPYAYMPMNPQNPQTHKIPDIYKHSQKPKIRKKIGSELLSSDAINLIHNYAWTKEIQVLKKSQEDEATSWYRYKQQASIEANCKQEKKAHAVKRRLMHLKKVYAARPKAKLKSG